jgi:hypothetical protein
VALALVGRGEQHDHAMDGLAVRRVDPQAVA